MGPAVDLGLNLPVFSIVYCYGPASDSFLSHRQYHNFSYEKLLQRLSISQIS